MMVQILVEFMHVVFPVLLVFLLLITVSLAQMDIQSLGALASPILCLLSS